MLRNIKADKEVLTLACLLHDIAFKNGSVKDHSLVGAKEAEKILIDLDFPKEKIKKIVLAIEDHDNHFSHLLRKKEELQIESRILRDADNIDALGRIGLHRMIAFSKSQGFPKFSEEEGINKSLYGNLKFLLTWPDEMLTLEGKTIGEKSLDPIKNYIQKLKKGYKRKQDG